MEGLEDPHAVQQDQVLCGRTSTHEQLATPVSGGHYTRKSQQVSGKVVRDIGHRDTGQVTRPNGLEACGVPVLIAALGFYHHFVEQRAGGREEYFQWFIHRHPNRHALYFKTDERYLQCVLSGVDLLEMEIPVPIRYLTRKSALTLEKHDGGSGQSDARISVEHPAAQGLSGRSPLQEQRKEQGGC
jgi:hypothetical protein